jgi:nucleoside-diphosphate-sugar epimerase
MRPMLAASWTSPRQPQCRANMTLILAAVASHRRPSWVGTSKVLFPKLTVETQPGEPPISKSQPLDISRACELLGWQPRFSLREALLDYADELHRARVHLKSFDR